MTNDLNIIVCYFPRSAGNFLIHACSQNFKKNGKNLNILHTHDKKWLSDKRTISIIRDPYESIVSTIVAGLITKYQNKTDQIDETLILEHASNHILEYVSFYNEAIKNNTLVFKFEDVINNTKDVVLKISNMFDYELIDNFNNDIKFSIKNHIPSSKNSSLYNTVSQTIIDKDILRPCYETYKNF